MPLQTQAQWTVKATPGTKVLFLSSHVLLEWNGFIHMERSGLSLGTAMEES